jgi:hypothetical protein
VWETKFFEVLSYRLTRIDEIKITVLVLPGDDFSVSFLPKASE